MSTTSTSKGPPIGLLEHSMLVLIDVEKMHWSNELLLCCVHAVVMEPEPEPRVAVARTWRCHACGGESSLRLTRCSASCLLRICSVACRQMSHAWHYRTGCREAIRRSTCDHCCSTNDASELKLCSGCHRPRYCSDACQKRAWSSGHSQICKAASSPAAGVVIRHEVNNRVELDIRRDKQESDSDSIEEVD